MQNYTTFCRKRNVVNYDVNIIDVASTYSLKFILKNDDFS